MTALTAIAVAVLALAAVAVTVVGGVRTGGWAASARLGLRFVLGAALLTLTGQPGWWAAATVGAVVALEALVDRRAIGARLRAGRRRPAGWSRS